MAIFWPLIAYYKQIGGYVLISFQRWQFQRRGYKIFGSFLGTRSFSGREQERAKRAKIVCPPPYQFFTISCMYYGSSVLQLCRQSERSWEIFCTRRMQFCFKKNYHKLTRIIDQDSKLRKVR